VLRLLAGRHRRGPHRRRHRLRRGPLCGVSGDESFEADVGIELLVETARFWCSLGHYERDGSYRIDGVTGPDEYSALADNNVYTNLMAQLNLRAAADVSERYPHRASELSVSGEEIADWRQTAASMFVPYDEQLGVHPQAENFTRHQEWDFGAMTEEDYPLLLHYPYFDLYRKQVVKQADLVLAMRVHSDTFTADEKVRNFAYYERLTVRDSSLSACTQAVLAAEIGHLDLAHDYIAEAALMDLADLEHNTRDGLHIASLAGAWTAVVEGLGGLRTTDSMISFCPRLPPGLSRLKFGILYRGRRLQVTVERDNATYELVDGRDMRLSHHTSTVSLTVGQPVSRPIPPAPVVPPPSQVPGREPIRRRLGN
jgi:alpha,alpha-trehalose phosphorylase